MRRLEQTFIAKGADGKEYTIHVHREYAPAPSTFATEGQGISLEPGNRRYTTADGQHVNRRGKGNYLIAATGVVLTSDDPNAP